MARKVVSLTPRGNNRLIWEYKDDQVLVEGAAGTGKTYSILAMIYLMCLKYQGMRVAIVRQTRVSMTQSVLVTWETKILPYKYKLHTTRQSYRIGRSEVVVCGLDNPAKLLSSEFDLIYLNEGTEASEEAVEIATTRLRAGVIANPRLIVDVNPTYPQHHLNVRAKVGMMRRITTTHLDNPTFWNEKRQKWTVAGENYLRKLQALTGARRRRFFEGVWEADEGLVIDTWEDDYDAKIHPTGNVTDEAAYIANGGEVFLAVDDGYAGKIDPVSKLYTAGSHPRVFLFIQRRANGRFAVVHEMHGLNRECGQHVAEAVAYAKANFTGTVSVATPDTASKELVLQLNKNFIATMDKPSDVVESL